MSERVLNQLLIKGVGWRVVEQVSSNGSKTLLLHLGFHRPFHRPVPAGVEVTVTGGDKEGTRLHLSSTDARSLGDYSASIRRLRKYNRYTGEGIFRVEKGAPLRKAGKRKS